MDRPGPVPFAFRFPPPLNYSREEVGEGMSSPRGLKTGLGRRNEGRAQWRDPVRWGRVIVYIRLLWFTERSVRRRLRTTRRGSAQRRSGNVRSDSVRGGWGQTESQV